MSSRIRSKAHSFSNTADYLTIQLLLVPTPMKSEPHRDRDRKMEGSKQEKYPLFKNLCTKFSNEQKIVKCIPILPFSASESSA